MWKLITIVIAKLLIAVLRLFGQHGTALPGLVAERMHPHLLAKLMKSVPGGSVVVTGTNGKTTTAKLLRKILQAQGLSVLSNPSGSNFTRGIIASIIDHASWSGQLEYDIAVLEVDEAYTPLIAAEIKPRTIVVLNVMRDQLDRYGEIDNTVAMIGRALEHSEGLVVNIDDTPLEVLPKLVRKTTTFGASASINELLPSDNELHTEQKILKHSKHKIDIQLQDYEQDIPSRLTIATPKGHLKAQTQLDGVHNYLNVTAALATIWHLFGAVDQTALEAVSTIRPAFGRGERLSVDGKTIHLALVKNPAGFNQNARSFMTKKVGLVLFIINDRIADGRDVSWLWDINLEPIVKERTKVMTGGIRAYDMALRLAHEDVNTELIEQKIANVLNQAIEQTPENRELLILPTYTAMLETRKLLLKRSRGL